MIENRISQLTNQFGRFWEESLSVSPLLRLDGSWPSLAVVDLLTFGLRLRDDLEEKDNRMIEEVAGYVATFLDRCWRVLGAEVTVFTDIKKGISVSAKGGQNLGEKGEFLLPLEKVIRDILRDLPFPFPVFRDYASVIAFDSQIMNLFGLGIATGLSPYVQGAWEERQSNESPACLGLVIKELAKQSAERYASLYPNEPLGQVAELYLGGMIYPPPLMSEPVPMAYAAQAMLGFFREYNVSQEKVQQLSHNLSLSINDQFSSAGLAFFVALTDGVVPPEVLAVSERKGKYMGILRPTIAFLREELGKGQDWTEVWIKGPDQEKQYQVDRTFNLIPWLTLSLSRLKLAADDKDMHALIKVICEFDIEAAISICGRFVESDPADIEMRIQRIKLEMMNGDVEHSRVMLESLASEPAAEQNPLFYHLWGTCFLELQDYQKATRCFKAGLAVSDKAPMLKGDLANNTGWALLLQEDLDTSLEYFEIALQNAACPLTPMLNKAHILWRKGQREELKELYRKAFALAPADRRVFAMLRSLD